MLGGIVKGLGSSLAGGIADVAGISTFASAAGGEKKPKAAKVKAFDEDESPTKILQRILTEVQTIHKVMASQIVPESEKKEEEMDKDKKDEEILEALEDLRPDGEKDKKKKKKTPWWKMLWAWIKPFISWITKPLSWIKSLLKWPFFMALRTFAVTAARFFFTNPVGIALLVVGIIVLNWQAVRKSISHTIIGIRDTIKEILEFIPFVDPPEDWDEGTEEVRKWGRTVEEREAEEGGTIKPQPVEKLAEPSLLEAPEAEAEEELKNLVLFGGDRPLTNEEFQNYDYPAEYQDYIKAYNLGEEYVRQYGAKYERDPNLDFIITPTRKYDKLITNEERLRWLDRHIKLFESPEFMQVGETGRTLQAIEGLESEKERVLQYAGQFKGGGMIPKGKVGLAGEGSAPESVKGTMLGGPSLVEGPARVRRESGLDKKKAMKETGSDFAMGQYLPRQILGKTRDKDFMKRGIFPGSSFYIELQEEIVHHPYQYYLRDLPYRFVLYCCLFLLEVQCKMMTLERYLFS